MSPARTAGGDSAKLSYAAWARSLLAAGAIRALEWLTAKPRALALASRFRARGIPEGPAFWDAALEALGIALVTPPQEIARIPARGPVVVVANHPFGLVDGLALAALVARVRRDGRLIARSLMTDLPALRDMVIPIPYPHDPDARPANLAARRAAVAHLACGGAVMVFPAGAVATAASWTGPAVEGEWLPFTAKMILRSGACVVPVRFCGQNSRAFQIAARLSPTLQQGLMMREIVIRRNRPIAPIVGPVIAPAMLAQNPRALADRLRAAVLAMERPPDGR
ncbi:MAG: 1-acyl-sn-glycerol-3-phosphate acyltransferase [Gemmobacter sp.]